MTATLRNAMRMTAQARPESCQDWTDIDRAMIKRFGWALARDVLEPTLVFKMRCGRGGAKRETEPCRGTLGIAYPFSHILSSKVLQARWLAEQRGIDYDSNDWFLYNRVGLHVGDDGVARRIRRSFPARPFPKSVQRLLTIPERTLVSMPKHTVDATYGIIGDLVTVPTPVECPQCGIVNEVHIPSAQLHNADIRREALVSVVRSSIGDLINARDDEMLAEWQRRFMSELKSAGLAAVALAKGSWSALGPEDTQRVGEQLSSSYRMLMSFASELADGDDAAIVGYRTRVEIFMQSVVYLYLEARLIEQEWRDGVVTRAL